MARHNLTRSLGIGLALASLAFAACSKSGSTPTPNPSGVPTASPIASGVPTTLSSPCASSLGIAYEPDGGNGGTFNGVQVTHFEDNAQNLCGAAPGPTAAPPAVAFGAPVGALAFSTDLSDAVALLRNASGRYTLAQDIFGANVGAIVPVGTVYDLSMQPPTPSPSSSASATPASPAPLLSDAQSIGILGSSSFGVAVTAGTAASGSPNALVALTSLTNAPPQYGGNATLMNGATYTLKSIPTVPRSIVRFGVDSSQIVALVRGPQDLLAFSVSNTYQFDAKSDDTTLGSSVTLRGNGALAFSPADAGRALVGGTSSGQSSILTLVTGLPKAITKSSTVSLPGNVQSVAITTNGQFGVVGTDVGIVVVKGVDTGTLSIVPPFAGASGSASVLSYRSCAGTTANLTNVASVGLSSDTKYLVALGTTAGLTCPSGYNASLVAVPFNPATGTSPTPGPSTAPSPGATAVPATFVQNNVIAPPAGADYLFVH